MKVYPQKAGSLKNSPSGPTSLNALITLSYWNIIFKHPKTLRPIPLIRRRMIMKPVLLHQKGS